MCHHDFHHYLFILIPFVAFLQLPNKLLSYDIKIHQSIYILHCRMKCSQLYCSRYHYQSRSVKFKLLKCFQMSLLSLLCVVDPMKTSYYFDVPDHTSSSMLTCNFWHNPEASFMAYCAFHSPRVPTLLGPLWLTYHFPHINIVWHTCSHFPGDLFHAPPPSFKWLN